MELRLEVAETATDELFAGMRALVPQLSSSAPPLTREVLAAVVTCPTNTFVVAWADDRLVGALTLVVFPIPTGVRAWIEDVVVDGAARGLGVGARLTDEAVRLARDAGARTVDLTSRPSRAAANRLYERAGFELRDSKVYRLTLDR